MDGRFGGVGRGDGCEQKEIGFILFSFFVLKNVGSTALGRSFLFFSTQMGLVSSGLGFFFKNFFFLVFGIMTIYFIYFSVI